MINLRDRAWVQRIVKGDRAAGERLVSLNYRGVYTMLRSLAGSREAAEDLTQQTFLSVWEALPTYRGEARVSTWIRRIAYHEYTHWRRAHRLTVPLDDACEVADLRSLIGLETVLVGRALESLSDELRETFLLRNEHELSIAEVALVLGVPPGTVKSRLFTARARLRELLADALGDKAPAAPATIVAPLAGGR